MSKLKKILATSLLVVVSGFSYLGGAIGNIAKSLFSVGTASAASFKAGNKGDSTSVKQGNVLSVTGLQTSVKLGESVAIKFGESSDNNVTAKTTSGASVALTKSNLFIEVIDPYGASLTKWNETSMEVVDTTQVTLTDTTLTLKPTVGAGAQYTIRFHQKTDEGIWTSTGNYTIEVSSSACQMKMVANDTIPMPVSFKTGVSEKESQKISLPLLYDENGELIENENVLLKNGDNEYIVNYKTLQNVTFADVSAVEGLPTINTYAEYKTYTIKKYSAGEDTYNYILDLSIKTTGDATTVNFDSSIGTNEANYEKVATTFVVKKGKNVLTYTLKDSSGTELARYSHTITGSDQYESENIELNATVSKKLDNLDFKTKVYLPKLNASNKNNTEEDLAFFYYYVITDESGAVTNDIKMGRDENGFWIEPSSSVGTTYKVCFNAIDAFGNSVTDKENGVYKEIPSSYNVKVVDTKLDNYAITNSYNVDEFNKVENADNMKDATYLVPSKVNGGDSITLPALWAYDKSGIKDAYITLSSSSATFISSTHTIEEGSIKTATESKSGELRLVTTGGATETTLGLPLKEGATETKDTLSLSDYITYKAYDGKYYYEEATSRGNDAIGNIRICTTNSTRDTNDGYLYFYAKDENGSGNYYKSLDGSKPATTTDDGKTIKVEASDIYTEENTSGKYKVATKEEIRNFKLSCETVLKLDSNVFEAGSYKLTYYIKDNNSGYKRYEGCSFEVVASTETLEATNPTVTFSDNKVSNVANNQEITISTPTVSDSTDSRLFVRYYAVVDTNVQLISQGLASETKIEFNTNMTMGGSTLYDLAKNSRSFKIVALAYNHFANYEQEYTSDWASLGNDAKKGIGFAELTISVKNGDTVAPEFAVFPTNDTAPEQNASYQVSGVTFYDNSDDAKVMVEITDTDGRIYTDYSVGTLDVDYDNSKSSYKYVFSGVTFTPTNADNEKYYTVTYKLVDKGDNVTAYSFVLLHVTDKTPPVITLKTESRTVELGETLDIVFDANDNTSENLDNTVTCTDANGKTHNFASIKGNTIHFEGDKIGTYTLALTSTDEGSNESTREFTIEVKDTLAPTISVKNSSGSELVFSSNSLELPAIKETEMYNDDGTTATIKGIPTATVADSKPENALNTVDFGATGRITITTPNSNDGVSEFVYDLNGDPISNTNPLKLTRNGNTFEFTPFGTNFRGEYKIVYSATDNNGNSATSKTITISVGDTEKPSIYLTQTLEDILSKGFILGENDTLEINPKAKIKENATDYSDVDLYVSDNLGFAYKKAKDGTATKDIDDSADLLVTVNFYITDPNGSTLSKETDTESSKTTYKFTTAGTYTITFYVTDVAGNRSQNVTRKFVVKAKTTTSVDTSTIVGTVLIVISALILAGIIVYLVRGVKLLPKKNKKTSKKADKKTDNKVEE